MNDQSFKRHQNSNTTTTTTTGPVVQLDQRPPSSTKSFISGVYVEFPYNPYSIQVEYMRKVIDALHGNENALLESPTGTGKTLSLLCAALSWLKHVESGSVQTKYAPPHYISTHSDITDQVEFNKRYFTNSARGPPMNINNTNGNNDNNSAFPNDPQLNKVFMVITNTEQNTSITYNNTNNSLVAHPTTTLDPQQQQQHQGQSPMSHPQQTNSTTLAQTPSFGTVMGNGTIKSRIIYAARTHTQLTQVVREINKTSFKANIRTLGGRDRLCLNDNVRAKPQSLQRSECSKLVSERTCMYRTNLDQFVGREGANIMKEKMMDIEDLIFEANQHRVCPYYWSRHDLAQADVILVPYQYLIDPLARTAVGLHDLIENAILIIDEAHNLELTCQEAASATIPIHAFDSALAELNIIKKKLADRDDGRDASVSLVLQNQVKLPPNAPKDTVDYQSRTMGTDASGMVQQAPGTNNNGKTDGNNNNVDPDKPQPIQYTFTVEHVDLVMKQIHFIRSGIINIFKDPPEMRTYLNPIREKKAALQTKSDPQGEQGHYIAYAASRGQKIPLLPNNRNVAGVVLYGSWLYNVLLRRLTFPHEARNEIGYDYSTHPLLGRSKTPDLIEKHDITNKTILFPWSSQHDGVNALSDYVNSSIIMNNLLKQLEIMAHWFIYGDTREANINGEDLNNDQEVPQTDLSAVSSLAPNGVKRDEQRALTDKAATCAGMALCEHFSKLYQTTFSELYFHQLNNYYRCYISYRNESQSAKELASWIETQQKTNKGSGSYNSNSGYGNYNNYGNSLQLASNGLPVVTEQNESDLELNLWCFSASVIMNHIYSLKPRSMILTSGTLSPLNSFKTEIGIPIHHELENDHIVNPKQVFVGVLTHGLNGAEITTKYNSRSDTAMWAGLGAVVNNMSKLFRGSGVLIFVPSYSILNLIKTQWRSTPHQQQQVTNSYGPQNNYNNNNNNNYNNNNRGYGTSTTTTGYNNNNNVQNDDKNNPNGQFDTGYPLGSIFNTIAMNLIPFFESRDSGGTDVHFILQKKKNEFEAKLEQEQLLAAQMDSNSSDPKRGYGNKGSLQARGPINQRFSAAKKFGTVGSYNSGPNSTSIGGLLHRNGGGIGEKRGKLHYTDRMDPSAQVVYREDKMNFDETIREFRGNIDRAQVEIKKIKSSFSSSSSNQLVAINSSDHNNSNQNSAMNGPFSVSNQAAPSLFAQNKSPSITTIANPPTSTAQEITKLVQADPKTRGSLLFGISRGKASEGIDFSDDQGRAVVVLGLPLGSWVDPQTILKSNIFDSINSAQTNEKTSLLSLFNLLNQRNRNIGSNAQDSPYQGLMLSQLEWKKRSQYLTDQEQLKGDEWYQQNAMRAVNQAIGRVVRHRYDYGAIILADSRIAEKRNRDLLSKWLQKMVFVPNPPPMGSINTNNPQEDRLKTGKMLCGQILSKIVTFSREAPLIAQKQIEEDRQKDLEYRQQYALPPPQAFPALLAPQSSQVLNNNDDNLLGYLGSNTGQNGVHNALVDLSNADGDKKTALNAIVGGLRPRISLLGQGEVILDDSVQGNGKNDQNGQNAPHNSSSNHVTSSSSLPIKRTSRGEVINYRGDNQSHGGHGIDDDEKDVFGQKNKKSSSLTNLLITAQQTSSKKSIFQAPPTQNTTGSQPQHQQSQSQSQHQASQMTNTSSLPTPEMEFVRRQFASLLWSLLYVYVSPSCRRSIASLCGKLVAVATEVKGTRPLKDSPEFQSIAQSLVNQLLALPEVLPIYAPLLTPSPYLNPGEMIGMGFEDILEKYNRMLQSDKGSNNVQNDQNGSSKKLPSNATNPLVQLSFPRSEFSSLRSQKTQENAKQYHSSIYAFHPQIHPFLAITPSHHLNPTLLLSSSFPHHNPSVNSSLCNKPIPNVIKNNAPFFSSPQGFKHIELSTPLLQLSEKDQIDLANRYRNPLILMGKVPSTSLDQTGLRVNRLGHNNNNSNTGSGVCSSQKPFLGTFIQPKYRYPAHQDEAKLAQFRKDQDVQRQEMAPFEEKRKEYERIKRLHQEYNQLKTQIQQGSNLPPVPPPIPPVPQPPVRSSIPVDQPNPIQFSITTQEQLLLVALPRWVLIAALLFSVQPEVYVELRTLFTKTFQDLNTQNPSNTTEPHQNNLVTLPKPNGVNVIQQIRTAKGWILNYVSYSFHMDTNDTLFGLSEKIYEMQRDVLFKALERYCDEIDIPKDNTVMGDFDSTTTDIITSHPRYSQINREKFTKWCNLNEPGFHGAMVEMMNKFKPLSLDSAVDIERNSNNNSRSINTNHISNRPTMDANNTSSSHNNNNPSPPLASPPSSSLASSSTSSSLSFENSEISSLDSNSSFNQSANSSLNPSFTNPSPNSSFQHQSEQKQQQLQSQRSPSNGPIPPPSQVLTKSTLTPDELKNGLGQHFPKGALLTSSLNRITHLQKLVKPHCHMESRYTEDKTIEKGSNLVLVDDDTNGTGRLLFAEIFSLSVHVASELGKCTAYPHCNAIMSRLYTNLCKIENPTLLKHWHEVTWSQCWEVLKERL